MKPSQKTGGFIMNISSATSAVPNQYGANADSIGSSDSEDNNAAIKDLEGKKAQLEQKLKAANEPFSTKPSKEYASLKKELAEVERKIQDLKADTKKKEKASSSSRDSFDQYKPGDDKLETGAYSQGFGSAAM
jgi:chromosome segregation ATPase